MVVFLLIAKTSGGHFTVTIGMGNAMKCAPMDSKDVIRLMMPVYFTSDDATEKDLEYFRECWNAIVLNHCPQYKRMYRTYKTNCETCLSWFFHIFFHRLFLVHPSCKAIFSKEIFLPSKFLVKLVSILLSFFDANNRFLSMITLFRDYLSLIGLTIYDMGVVGEVFIYSLGMCLDEEFCDLSEIAFKRIYSKFLYEVAVQQTMPTSKQRRFSTASAGNQI